MFAESLSDTVYERANIGSGGRRHEPSAAAKNLEPVENIARSAAGHKVLYLLRLTDLSTSPGYDPKLWGRVAQWRSAWRYETDMVSHATAQEFVNDVQAVVNWLSSKITGE